MFVTKTFVFSSCDQLRKLNLSIESAQALIFHFSLNRMKFFRSSGARLRKLIVFDVSNFSNIFQFCFHGIKIGETEALFPIRAR